MGNVTLQKLAYVTYWQFFFIYSNKILASGEMAREQLTSSGGKSLEPKCQFFISFDLWKQKTIGHERVISIHCSNKLVSMNLHSLLSWTRVAHKAVSMRREQKWLEERFRLTSYDENNVLYRFQSLVR